MPFVCTISFCKVLCECVCVCSCTCVCVCERVYMHLWRLEDNSEYHYLGAIHSDFWDFSHWHRALKEARLVAIWAPGIHLSYVSRGLELHWAPPHQSWFFFFFCGILGSELRSSRAKHQAPSWLSCLHRAGKVFILPLVLGFSDLLIHGILFTLWHCGRPPKWIHEMQ